MRNEVFIKKDSFNIFKSSLDEKNVYIINAVSGCGKTTFIYKFLEENDFRYKYIHITEEDIDPINMFNKISTYFKYPSLPRLTVDFLNNISVFSEIYFKTIFKNDFDFLIFDDVHNIKFGKYSQNILKSLIRNFALSDKKLIILTKEDLEIPYFEWEIEKKIFRIDTNFFRFNKNDIKNFFSNIYYQELTENEIENIIKSTNGIIAKILVVSDISNISEITYKNLENKLFKLIGEENLKKLTTLYPFYEINANVLKYLKYGDKIKQILEILYLENLLVSKVDNKYKLHDILQEFLLLKSKQYFKENYDKFLENIADILYKVGYINKSIELLEETKNYKKISNILQNHIIDYIHEGRIYSLQRLLAIIENTSFMNNPLFLFAKGYLLKFQYPEKAINYFLKALDMFKNLGNLQGEKLVIGELFDLVQFYGEDFEVGGKYLDRAEELIKVTKNFSKIDIRLISYMGIIYLLYKGNVEKSYHYFKILNKIINQLNSKYNIFFSYIKLYSAITYSAIGKFEEANEIFREGCEIYKNSNKNPNDIFMFNFLGSMYEVFIGNFKEAIRKGKKGLEIVNKWNLLKHKEHMISRLVRGLLGIGDVENAKKYLKEVKNLPFRSSFSKAITYQLETQIYLTENKFDLAEEKAQKALEIFTKVNSRIFEMSTSSLLAVAYIEKGYYSEAESILKEIVNWSKKTNNILQEFTSLMHLSYLYLKQNRETNLRDTLKKTLKLAKMKGIKAIFYQYPSIFKSVLDKAIELDIESDYANYLLKYHNLKTESTYRVKIFTFGKLKVLINDKELTYWHGKKPLLLLKAILSLGGENISVERIIELIWDENDYIKSKQNFEFTLRKLRKILKDEKKEILELKNGRLSFNKNLVWIDFWEFEDICAKLENLKNKYPKHKYSEKFNNLLADLRYIYKGKFLENEEEYFTEGFRKKLDDKYIKFTSPLNRN